MQLNSPSFTIIVSEKGGAERRQLFSVTELSVGRVQGNDLLLPKGNVSKQHAKVFLRDGRFIVTDLNSTNGTYVNRRRIQQATAISDGDRIYIGDFVLRIEPVEDSASGGRTGEQSALAVEEIPAEVHDSAQAAHARTTDSELNKVPEGQRNSSHSRMGTHPSWSDQSTGRVSLNSALAGTSDRSGNLAGRTVRTDASLVGTLASSASKEPETTNVLGSLVDAVLKARHR